MIGVKRIEDIGRMWKRLVARRRPRLHLSNAQQRSISSTIRHEGFTSAATVAVGTE